MIISESERNRIKSLYGLIREDSPPSESVLVANKNPFKYTEYENARKTYNSDLKDGELFYVVSPSVKEYYINSYKSLYDSFLGKTIRDTKNDKILKIEKSDKPVVVTDKTDNIRGRSNESGTDIRIKFNYKINGPYGYDTIVNYNSTPSEYFSGEKEPEISILKPDYIDTIKWDGRTYRQVHPTYESDVYNAFISIGNKIKETFQNNLSDISKIPDEYFEIRKVERQKTDF